MDAFREAQVLVLIAVFLLACAGKFASPGKRLFLGYAVAESLMCLGMVVTGHVAVRLVVAMALVAATWMLGELRTRDPDNTGCGCFGKLSDTKVGRRTVFRTGLLAASAVLALTVPASGLDVAADALGWRGVIFVVEFVFLVAVSPESAALVKRTRIPCDRKNVPLRDTLAVLHGSGAYAEFGGRALGEPSEIWRELCWRFVVYPLDGGEVVFAVSLADKEVRAAFVDQEVSGVAETAPNPAYILA